MSEGTEGGFSPPVHRVPEPTFFDPTRTIPEMGFGMVRSNRQTPLSAPLDPGL